MSDTTNDRLTFAGTIVADGRRLKGSVKIAGHQTPRNGERVEIDLPALMRADRTGAVMVVGHQAFSDAGYDPLRTVARHDNGSLQITPTDEGFDYETAELPNTTYANDALELARSGVFGGTSFDIFGLRSQVRVEPGNIRVRRYTSIAKFGAVTPVVEPAFPSSVAVFSKESHVTEIIEEPVVAPEPKAPIVATPTPDTKSDTFRTAEAFARKQELGDLEAAMDNLFASGVDTPAKGDVYDAFSTVYDERKKANTDARERQERIGLSHAMRLGKMPKPPMQAGALESEDYRQAFGSYLRDGRPSHMEQFAQSIAGDGTQGGFTVPDGFRNKIQDRLKAYGGIAKHAEELVTSTGESLRWTSNDDTANTAAIATEGAAPGSGGADLVFDDINLGAYSYASTGTGNSPLKVSLELLQDSAFDVEALVSRKLSERIGRKQATDIATGSGSGAPLGLFQKSNDTMTATVVSLALPEHVLQVDSEYRDLENCRWILSDTTLIKVWQSQDTTNRPMIVPGEGLDGKPAQLLWGFPYQIDPAAGTLVAFGDIRLGYVIRRVRGVQVLVDPYTAQSTRQIAYHAWARMDATIQDSFAYSVSEWSTVSADT